MELILASNNRGKIAEISQLLAPRIYVRSMADIGFLTPIEEPFDTFRDNARVKAQTVNTFCGLPVLADDSGLCVDALLGAPGVWSARYAGEGATDAANNDKLLHALTDITGRQAHYIAVLCLILPAGGGMHFFEGRCDGRIAMSPRGRSGFGYDPLFIPDGFEETFGELPADVKAGISHRAKALERLTGFLKSAAGATFDLSNT